MTDLNLYLVTNGEATEVSEPVETDGFASILVAATDTAAAVAVGAQYDDDLVEYDNMEWYGKTIAVVRAAAPEEERTS